MAGPTFCPHSFACWGEIAQPCGCSYCRRRMSVTIQKETLAFYDYYLCVPPLKTRVGEIVHVAFLALCWWLGSSMKGCTDISLLWRRYSDPMPKPRGPCPTMPLPCLNGIWGLVCSPKHTTMLIRFVRTTKALGCVERTDFLQQRSKREKCLQMVFACALQWLENCWFWTGVPSAQVLCGKMCDISNHRVLSESSAHLFLPRR